MKYISAVWKADLELCVKILGQKTLNLKNSRSGKKQFSSGLDSYDHFFCFTSTPIYF